MTLGSILLATALLLLVGVLVLRPLLVSGQRAVLPMTERERLSAEKAALLTQIRSLDFDYETGKLPEDSYQRERLLLMQEAADKLRLLDRLPAEEGIDARIEAAVAALRKNQIVDNEALAKQEASVCPQCGIDVTAEDKFCRACGERLHVEA